MILKSWFPKIPGMLLEVSYSLQNPLLRDLTYCVIGKGSTYIFQLAVKAKETRPLPSESVTTDRSLGVTQVTSKQCRGGVRKRNAETTSGASRDPSSSPGRLSSPGEQPCFVQEETEAQGRGLSHCFQLP